MPRWLLLAVLATLLWGGWGVASKLAEQAGVPAYLVQALLPVGLVPVAAVLVLRPGAAGPDPRRGAAYGVLTGVVAGVGNWAFFEALAVGPASTVAPLAGVFPLVTLVLAVGVLRERLNPVQVGGVVLGVAAVVVFSLPADAAPAAGGGAGWLAYALAAVGLWGAAGVTQKLATNWTSGERSTLWFCAAFALVGAAMLAARPPAWGDLPAAGVGWTAAVGVLNGLAILAAFAAYGGGGKAAVVTPLIALYPVVVVALAVPVFGERPGGREWAGVGLAVAAAVALSVERAPEGSR